jgi:hypothetical protein
MRVVCSVDKARELGLDWWNHSARADRLASERNVAMEAMGERLGRLEQALGAVVAAPFERGSAANG